MLGLFLSLVGGGAQISFLLMVVEFRRMLPRGMRHVG